MARDGSNELLGVAELSAKLEALTDKVKGEALRQSVREAAKPVAEAARARLPVGKRAHKTYKGKLVPPGYARMSLRLKTWVSRDKAAAVAMIGVAPDAYYALQFVELGTSKMDAQPWLVPAFEANRSPMLTDVGTALRNRIERIARARAAPGYVPGSIRPEGMRRSGSSRSRRVRATGRG